MAANWVYIQEPDVRVGRVQLFNNWSPYLVSDPDQTWLGLEYFCNEGDELWNADDTFLLDLASTEMETIGFCRKEECLDGTVVRMPGIPQTDRGQGPAEMSVPPPAAPHRRVIR